MESTTLSKASSLNTIDRYCRQLLLKAMASADFGTLVIRDPDAEFRVQGRVDPDYIHAEIHVEDTSCYRHMVFAGSIGASEAYMTADWTTPDLTAVIRFMSRNLHALNQLENGLARITRPLQRFYHWSNRNTEKGSRRNIAAHYDLGNDLFELFLDPTMMYSAGIFPSADATLEQASVEKLDRICRKLDLQPDDHVVEIGTGWGGFAIHAVTHYGCKVTTTTISRQQYDYAKARVEKLGLQDRITLLLEDYRDMEGQFDKLVSIEMVEAVGHQFYPAYFEALGRLLKPEGLALIQAITIDDKRYHDAIRNVDFIQRYIFPGSCIPSVTALLTACGQSSDMQLTHMKDITPHYARTLREWRNNFFRHEEQIRKLGYSAEFVRMWDFYFCYCEGGFAERVIGDVQLLFAKPAWRSQPVLGAL
ncbi:MAG: cyclopropane-fatty-acyl-phospholipid synthase family protein [Gammaproteobacteria bacterium]